MREQVAQAVTLGVVSPPSEEQWAMILCRQPLARIFAGAGSGKSTTLAAMVNHKNETEYGHILTVEDPIEFVHEAKKCLINQREVGPHTLSFANALRSALREDPDVILVGEMRDLETMALAITAAETGHLVLSTLHTNSAVETVTRLLDMGCDPFSFADAMLGVLAQRLARRICKDCKEQYVGTPEEYEELRQGYGADRWDKLGVKLDNTFRLARGKGCEVCNRSGFKGRVALHELLLGSDNIKRMVQQKARTEDMLHCALDEGMTTLVQDGIQKVLLGQTTYKEVKAVAIK